MKKIKYLCFVFKIKHETNVRNLGKFIFLFFVLLNRTNLAIAESTRSFSLQDAMDYASKESVNISKCQSELDLSETRSTLSYFSLGPTLTASDVYTLYPSGSGHSYNKDSPEKNNSFSLQINQPIVGLLKNSFKIRQSLNLEEQSKQLLNSAVINERINAAKSFLTAAQNKEILEITKTKLELYEKQYKDTELFFKSGDKTKIDLLQMQAAFFKAQSDVENAATDFKNALIDLAQALNINSTESISLVSEKTSYVEKKNLSFMSIQNALKKSMESNPSVLAANSLLKAVSAEKTQNVFNFFPDIYLFAGYMRESSSGNQLNNSSAFLPSSNSTTQNTLSYGLSLSWNIWDGGLIAANQAEIANRKRTAELDNEKIVKETQGNLTKNYNDFQNQLKVLEQSKIVLKTNEDIYKLSEIEYHSGQENALDLINVQNDLFNAQVGLVKIRANIDLAWLNLQAVVGELPSVL